MDNELVNATEYDGETTITLDNNATALVITPEEIQVYLPKIGDDDDVPIHVLLLTGVSIMLTNDDFVKRVLDVAFSEVRRMEG